MEIKLKAITDKEVIIRLQISLGKMKDEITELKAQLEEAKRPYISNGERMFGDIITKKEGWDA